MGNYRHSTSKVDWFYGTSRWINCSHAYIKSVGGLCERCLERGVYTPAEMVHHRVHLTPDNVHDESIALDWSNLEAVCCKCHAEIHAADRVRSGRWALDKDGRIERMADPKPLTGRQAGRG